MPGSDDVMLGYQSTSFHDALYARHLLGLRPAPEFAGWLDAMGLMGDDGAPRHALADALPNRTLIVASQAGDRTAYLTRPDLGRRLSSESADRLAAACGDHDHDLAIVLADGLSATATMAHGAAVATRILVALPDWRTAPLVIACQARVALRDDRTTPAATLPEN